MTAGARRERPRRLVVHRAARRLALAFVFGVGSGGSPLHAQSASETGRPCDATPAASLLRAVPIRVRIGVWGRTDSVLVRRVEEAERALGAAIRERAGGAADSLADGDTLVPLEELLAARTAAWVDVGEVGVHWTPAPRAPRAQLALLAPTLDRLVAAGGALHTLRARPGAPLRLGVTLRAGTTTDDRYVTAGVPVFTRRVLMGERLRIVDPGPSAVFPRRALQDEVEGRLLFDVVVDSTGAVDPASVTLVASVLDGIGGADPAAMHARHLAAFAAEAARVIRGRRFTPLTIAGCAVGIRAEQAIHFRIQE